jgi:hypothetical protein
MLSFVRARLAGWVIVLVPLLALMGYTINAVSLQLTAGRDVGRVPVLAFVPAAVAGVIGVAAGSPMEALERLSARRLRPASALYPIVLAALVTSALGLFLGFEGGDYGFAALFRNVAGLLGVALATATLFGSSMSWVAPFLIAVASVSIEGAVRSGAWWAWLSLPTHEPSSWAVAFTCLGSGVTMAFLRAPIRR